MSRLIRITGTVLALACIGYLVLLQAPQMPPLDWTSPGLWAGLSVALFAYVLSQFAAAEAWRAILSLCGVQIAAGLARGQPMVSGIGKYIPGNVAHLVGRLALGKLDGVPATTLGAAMVLEVGITLGVGIAVVGGLLVLRPDIMLSITAEFPQLATGLWPGVLAALLAIGIGAGTVALTSRLRRLGITRPSVWQLSKPLALHLVNFTILGISLWAMALAVAPASAPGLLTCAMVFAIAWVAGFLMPGAPGGIGVRDSILVLGLAASVGDGTGLTIALLHRGVSVLGDVVVFGFGVMMRRGHAQTDPRNGPKRASFATD